MPNINERRANWAPWIGFLLAAAALGCNALFFVKMPGERAIPWLSLFLAALALVFLVRGVKRAFSSRALYRGKVASVVLGILSVAVCAVTVLAFVKSHGLPPSAGAPQVGQKAPDFSLPDTRGNMVSLSQLLSRPGENGQVALRPKAVLLVFYRGYW